MENSRSHGLSLGIVVYPTTRNAPTPLRNDRDVTGQQDLISPVSVYVRDMHQIGSDFDWLILTWQLERPCLFLRYVAVAVGTDCPVV